jgi:hypothetical protein
VVHHFVDRHRNRGFVAQHHVADAVADEDHFDTRFIFEPRGGMIVGGEHDNFLAALLHLEQRPHRDFGA